ncbi:hypothetical protein MNBD_GAMMA08-2312 [hydrothermal vent metagenome]|uniref:Uncharacterized protein n=1 Tax=hydrothermal vent metagenome TaxID=652676 RepID=A0A3B0XR22_9ZZZZ
MPDKKDIPTLTHIVHEGDDSMLNHFDAHQLNEEGKTDTPELTENATSFENIDFDSADFECIEINSNELDDLPSLKADEGSADFSIDSGVIDTELSTANMDLENASEQAADTNRLEKQSIQKKIDEAIADAIPWIELNLKKQLYKKFDI